MFVRNKIAKDEIELAVEGPMSGKSAEEFQKTLQELAAEGHKTITLNLSAVPAMSSTCIGKILLLRKVLAEQDRLIRIKGCSDSLYNTFQLIKLDRLVGIER